LVAASAQPAASTAINGAPTTIRCLMANLPPYGKESSGRLKTS
jgi:hypothetical protein